MVVFANVQKKITKDKKKILTGCISFAFLLVVFCPGVVFVVTRAREDVKMVLM